MRRTLPPWSTAYSTNDTGYFLPVTTWLPTTDIERIRAVFELRARVNQLEVTLAYQTANVESSPDAATTFGAARSSDGIEYPTAFTDVSSGLEGKRLVRFGFFVKNTTGSAVSLGRVSGFVEIAAP